MRPDMAKVVTERPRRGHSNKSLKTGRRLSKDEFQLDDHGASRTPVSRHGQYGWDAKEFSDLLGPLRAYLRKQVGRPWNKVYSELSQTLDKRSISGLHIWDHVYSEVDRYPVIIKSRVYMHPQYGMNWIPMRGLYVHPINGLLCWAPDPRPHYRRPKDPNCEVLDALRQLEKREGIWYLLSYEIQKVEMKDYGPCRACRRAWHTLPTHRYHYHSFAAHPQTTGHDWEGDITIRVVEKKILLSKHQLNKRELRHYDKQNEKG